MARLDQDAKGLIEYFDSLGIKVNTNTKARGHQGFFTDGRIDVSKNVSSERVIPVLLHEFSHFVHKKIESDVQKTGGSLEVLFQLESLSELEVFRMELLRVTNFVDENSLCLKLNEQRAKIKNEIKFQESIIKSEYPEFMRSKKFKPFDKCIKKSKAKYLLSYDIVKYVSPFLRREEVFSIKTIENDFPELKPAFCAYLRLRSLQRRQSRVSRRVNKLNKYYAKPTELFARLVECIYIDEARAQALAPQSTKRFLDLLDSGYYFELKNSLEMLTLPQKEAIS